VNTYVIISCRSFETQSLLSFGVPASCFRCWL